MGRSERGSVAVEFGVMLPVVALLIGGLLAFGFVYTIQLTMNQAAREGARALALGEDPGAAVRAAAIGVPDSMGMTIEGSCDPTDPSEVGTTVGVRLTVVVDLPVPVPETVRLGARAVMRCGG